MPVTKRIARIFCYLIGLSMLSAYGALAAQAAPADQFSEAIIQVQKKLSQDPYTRSSTQAKRVTNDFIAGLVGAAWRLSHYARHLNAPAFSSVDEFIGLPGLFNPDNIYSNALLEETAQYLISGTRGTHVQMTFQFIDSFPMIGLSKDLLVIDLEEQDVKPGDDFELFIGGPKRGGLWWPMPKGAKAVLTRQTFSDWVNETPTTLHIARIGASSEIPDDTDRLSLAARYLEQTAALWADYYMAGLRRLPVNSMPPMRASKEKDGGLTGQESVMARFQLKDNEALIITARPSDAAYQGVQLGDYWFTTPNPVMHQSSLNLNQVQVNKDGLIRYVISLKDPGSANWLDPGGSHEGYILMRWQGIKTKLAATDQPLARKVLLSDLKKHLPEESLTIGPEYRRKQMASRSHFPASKR